MEDDFRAYLRCGILAHGFARIRCDACAAERWVAFSCKGRGVCPSCNARRMVEVAAHLTDHVLPPLPVRQWVLSLPTRIRPFLPHDPHLAGTVLRILLRASRTPLRRASPPSGPDAQLGAVSFLRHFQRRGLLDDHNTVADMLTWAGQRRLQPRCLRPHPRRRLRRAGQRPDSHPPDSPQRTAARSRWARLLARIYEVFPLLCPGCGAEMRILAFITAAEPVDAILPDLGLPATRRPSRPHAARPSTTSASTPTPASTSTRRPCTTRPSRSPSRTFDFDCDQSHGA